MKKHLLTLILLVLSFQLFAQLKMVTGTVTDTAQVAIVNASIQVYRYAETKPYASAVTDGNGKFNVPVMPKDIIQVSHIGYLSFRFGVDGNEFPAVKLKYDENKLGEITVKGVKPLVELQFDRTVVNVDGDAKAGINAVDVIRKIPGLIILNGNEIRFEGKGITINIDDKPTRLSGSDLINMLNSTSTGNISKVEVLYNPSAKYDAQGEGGILNIKTIKRVKPGYDGSLSLTGGYGWKYLTGNNASLSLNYRKLKDYFYLSYGISKGKQYQEIQTNTRIRNINQHLLDSAIFNSPYTSQNLRFGYDHYFNKKSIFGILLTGYYNASDPRRETSTQIFSNLAQSDSTRKSTNLSERLSKGFNINLNYKLTLDSSTQQEIIMDADLGRFNYHDDNFIGLKLLSDDGSILGQPYSLLQDGKTLTNILSFKTDYTQKVKGGTFETGVKISNVHIENDFNSIRKNDAGNGFDNGSNLFNYNETIAAGYVNRKFELRKLTVQTGLRAEHTFTRSYSPTLDSTIKRDYLSLFPNLVLGYKIKSHSLSASYSRRIGRPNYSYLNPFSIVRSAYSILQGNPYLLPSFTDNFRLGYGFKGKYTFSVTYRSAQDVITDLSRIDDLSKVTTDTKANLSANRNYGANLGYYNKLFKIWDVGLSVGFSNSRYRFNYQNEVVSIAQTSFTYSLDNRITLKKSWWLNAFLYGQTRVTYGNQINLPFSYLNLSAGKNILKGKASLSLTLNDIYYGSITRSKTMYGNLDYDTYSKYDSRNVRLNFTYNFGNTQVKIRRRTSGSLEEQGRSN
ncbi:outer membrane beta-barrel protein [Pedobacter aquatilis]|uniref:outer membrane beta-barrel protein n=1 Tax=Pedobacter aquatilis TaxID=351343 RepID=UPI00292D609A|nr:outer membrane beta-barrel protein [Pedobacter aquatilis]